MPQAPSPKPMPITPVPDDRAGNNDQVRIGKGVTFGNMQVTNGRPPKGRK